MSKKWLVGIWKIGVAKSAIVTSSIGVVCVRVSCFYLCDLSSKLSLDSVSLDNLDS